MLSEFIRGTPFRKKMNVKREIANKMLKYNFSIVIDAGLVVAVGATIGGGAAWYFYGKHSIMKGVLTGSLVAFQMSLLGSVREVVTAVREVVSATKCFHVLAHMAASYMESHHFKHYSTGLHRSNCEH